MSRTWVLGPTGQLGFYLVERLGGGARAIGREELDLRDVDQISSRLTILAKAERPGTIVNATAYNAVDRAETEADECMGVNRDAPVAIARWCAEQDVAFVHFSTDFVYSGTGSNIWREEDPALPVNLYGRSKWEGECRVAQAHPGAMIFRTSWVYSHRRSNFVRAILNQARTGRELNVVHDQIGSPTYADNLANYTLQILARPVGGTYNLADAGYVSRYEFAREILAQASHFEPDLAGVGVRPVDSSTLRLPAARPLNTRLDLTKVRTTFAVVPLEWRQGLSTCLRRMYAGD
ncbi:MAG: dTDP-4-dehydrorhamnose reductase [Bdellovibrionales bacterium]